MEGRRERGREGSKKGKEKRKGGKEKKIDSSLPFCFFCQRHVGLRMISSRIVRRLSW